MTKFINGISEIGMQLRWRNRMLIWFALTASAGVLVDFLGR